MTQEQIEKINKLCPEEQGVFVEPSGINTEKIKEPVIYMRWNTGGVTGGGYHENDYQHSYQGDGKPHYTVLDIVLEELGIDKAMAESAQVRNLIHEEDYDDDVDYYFNYDSYGVQYIILSELENILAK